MVKRFKKKRIVIKTGTASKTAVKALRVAKKALSMVAGELKILDRTGLGTTIPDGAGVIIQLNNVQIGDTNITREGNMILVKHISVELMLKINASASSSQIRVLLIRDKQTNGALYGVDDVLQSIANLTGLISPLDIDFKARFTILHDRIYILNRPGVSAVVSNVRHVKFNKRQNIKLRYDTDIGDITDLQSNSYSLLLIGSEITNAPTFDHFVRTKFIDN